MTFDAAAYQDQLLQLLPRGPAWPRDRSGVLGRLLGAFADALARIDARAAALLREADPSTALELLPEWERFAGLPDACVPIAGTVGARQAAVVRRLIDRGGQSRAFFVALAASLGAAIEIEEFHDPFVAGSPAGALLYDEAWRATWNVIVRQPDAGGIATTEFCAGSDAGDLLDSFSATVLECVISRAAPAHTTVLFSYPQEA